MGDMVAPLRQGAGWKTDHGQIYPTKAYRVIDTVTGAPERIPPRQNAITYSLDDAVAYLASRAGWGGRLIIEEITCYRHG